MEMLQVEEKMPCYCLTVEDLATSLSEMSHYSIESLAPSPWRANPAPSDHLVQPMVLGDRGLEVFLRKPAVTESSKQQPRLNSQKRKISGDCREKRFSHLDPHKYILAYRASRTNGIASAGTERRFYINQGISTPPREMDSTMKQRLQNIRSMMSVRGGLPVHYSSPQLTAVPFPAPSTPLQTASTVHRSTQSNTLYKTSAMVYTSSAPITTVTIEKSKQNSKKQPLVIVNMHQSTEGLPPMVPQPPIIHYRLPSTSPPKRSKEKIFEQSSPMCTCSCAWSSKATIEQDYVLTSDIIPLLKMKMRGTQGPGRLLSAKWRHPQNKQSTTAPMSNDLVKNEVKVKGLLPQSNDSEEIDNLNTKESNQTHFNDKQELLPHSLSVPRLSQVSFLRDSAVLSPPTTPLCKLNISQLKRPDSLPSIQQELNHPTFIDIHRTDVMGNNHFVPVRKCVSAKIGKETMGRHTRARMDARRHKRCLQKSAARQIAASNWKNFTATEFEITPIYTLK